MKQKLSILENILAWFVAIGLWLCWITGSPKFKWVLLMAFSIFVYWSGSDWGVGKRLSSAFIGWLYVLNTMLFVGLLILLFRELSKPKQ